jgi:hypothetical protein
MREQVCIYRAPIATAMAYRHQVAIQQGDIVLLALRNFQEDTPAQVILKYTVGETLRSGSCYSCLRGVRSLCLAVYFQ